MQWTAGIIIIGALIFMNLQSVYCCCSGSSYVSGDALQYSLDILGLVNFHVDLVCLGQDFWSWLCQSQQTGLWRCCQDGELVFPFSPPVSLPPLSHPISLISLSLLSLSHPLSLSPPPLSLSPSLSPPPPSLPISLSPSPSLSHSYEPPTPLSHLMAIPSVMTLKGWFFQHLKTGIGLEMLTLCLVTTLYKCTISNPQLAYTNLYTTIDHLQLSNLPTWV